MTCGQGYCYDAVIEKRRIHSMETKILVAYASKHGSTQEIAEAVAQTLREQGLAVDLQAVRSVRTLAGYRAVVLGAPLYIFHWHKDALQFLSRNRSVLEGGMPAAVFAGGPFGKGDEQEWQEVRRQLEGELAKFPWFKPAAVELVGGRFDPTRLRFPYNLIPALKQMPASDLRDWGAIRTWAINLAEQFQAVLA
jgi:menaquinone-dependent protoporphyrinogen oxidase